MFSSPYFQGLGFFRFSQRQFEQLKNEGLELRQNNQLEEAIQKFQQCTELDSNQFEPYKQIFEILLLLKNEFSECIPNLLKSLSYSSMKEQMQYLAQLIVNNEEEQRQTIQKIILDQEDKSFYLNEIATSLMKEKAFDLARQYFDLYLSCTEPENIPFVSHCLIYGCKSVFDQEEGLAYLNQKFPDRVSFKNIIETLIQQDCIQESLNITLFLENKFNNSQFLSELEEKLNEVSQYNQSFVQTNLEQILKIYEIAFERFPFKYELISNLSKQLLSIGHELAQSYSKKYLNFCPDDYSFHYHLGTHYSSKDDNTKAITHFEKIIDIYIRAVNKLDLELSNIFNCLAECYYNQSQFEKAAYYFQKKILTQKMEEISINQMTNIYSKLANCYFSIQKYQKCFEVLPKANFSSQETSMFLYSIYVFIKDNGDEDDLKKKIIDSAVDCSNNNPNCLIIQTLLIEIYSSEQQIEMAQVYFAKAEDIYLQNPDIHDSTQLNEFVTSGELFRQIKVGFYIVQNKLDEAEKLALEYYEVSKSEKSIFFLNKIYEMKQDTEKQKAFAELMTTNSDSFILNTVREAMKQKNYEQAHYLFQCYSVIKENNFSFYNEFGYCQENLGYLDKAIESYKLYLKNVQSDNTEVLYNLGNVMSKKEQFQEAKQYFEDCIKTNPKFGIAYQQLGLIFKKEQEYEKAAQLLEQAISINPELIDPLLEVIDIQLQYEVNYDYEKLNKYLEMARSINSEDKRIQKLSLLLKIKQQNII